MKITLIASLSVDGNIAKDVHQSSLDWNEKADTQFFVSKTKELGTVVMGWNTWRTIGKSLSGRRLIVLSRSKHDDQDGVEFVDETVSHLCQRLQTQGVKTLAVAGGASVYSQFLQAGLVDELYVTVAPVLFGEGVGFANGFDQIDLELQDVQRLGAQSALFHYSVRKNT